MDFMIDFTPELTIASPGRINIIGEHVDYNMGHVLPTAIDKKIIFKFRRNGSPNNCRVYSIGFEQGLNFDLRNIAPSKVGWENYVLGVIHEIQKRVTGLEGFECSITSHVPVGSGVSSSAALECGLAFGLNELFQLNLSKLDIVELSRDAEHNYVGTKCGIMDQFASVMSKKDHLILLDCESLDHEHIPFNLGDYKILMMNTNVAHSLASGEYNLRRADCEAGVAHIQKKYPEVTSLRHVTPEMLEECRHLMSEREATRCSYVIAENDRVLRAVEALKTGKLNTLGELMYQTHQGLSELYEVSCPELDFLVEFSKEFDSVLGSRMMGGGFGGCTINIIQKDAIQDFVAAASKAYEKQFNIKLSAFEALPSSGTSILPNNQ